MISGDSKIKSGCVEILLDVAIPDKDINLFFTIAILNCRVDRWIVVKPTRQLTLAHMIICRDQCEVDAP